MDREFLLSSLDEKIANLDKACLEAKRLKEKLIRLKDDLLKGEPNTQQNFIILTNLWLPSNRLWTNQICHDGINDMFTYGEALKLAREKQLKIPNVDDYMELIRFTKHVYENAKIGKFKSFGNDNYVTIKFNRYYVLEGRPRQRLWIDHSFNTCIHYDWDGKGEMLGNLLLVA